MNFALCCVAALAASTPSARPAVPPGERADPLPVVAANASRFAPPVVMRPLRVVRLPMTARALDAALSDPGRSALAGSLLVTLAGARVRAAELTTGSVRWSTAVPDVTRVSAASSVVAVQRRDGGVVALDLRTGRPRWRAAQTFLAGAGEHSVFTVDHDVVSARDERTGAVRWLRQLEERYSGGGAQTVFGTVLLPTVSDGALTVSWLRAFDVGTGGERWNAAGARLPPAAIIDSKAYFATQSGWNIDAYTPATVTWFDLHSGARDSASYAPDPELHWHGSNVQATTVVVSGAYVYVEVDRTWYRYDRDLLPGAAHPKRLTEFGAWLGEPVGDVFLVARDGALATLAMRRDDALLAPVPATDGVVRRVVVRGGTAFVGLRDGRVLAVDVAAGRVTRALVTPCASFIDVLFERERALVLCTAVRSGAAVSVSYGPIRASSRNAGAARRVFP